MALILAVAFALGLGFMAGRWTAPPVRVEMIWTPTVEAVTIAPPAEGGGLGVFVEGDLVGVWRPGDSEYRVLKIIHDNPHNPAARAVPPEFPMPWLAHYSNYLHLAHFPQFSG